ncbi:MAG: SMI1/KNR4 family protein [Chloroflexota bacterium]
MTAGQPAPPPDADTLLEQLRARAADPARRTDTRPGGLGAIVGKLSLGGLGFGRSGGGASRRASATDVKAAEEALGLTLPPFLVRVYTEVADGGFGPEEGLLPLARVVAETRRLLAGDPLPRRRRWPPTLLPLVQVGPGWTCVDAATGAVIDWDPEDLTEWASAARFRESFAERSPSLEAWLGRWVTRKTAAERNKPSAAERQARWLARAGSPANRAIAARKAVAMAAQLSPAERAEMGLPEEGWEQVIFDSYAGDAAERPGP